MAGRVEGKKTGKEETQKEGDLGISWSKETSLDIKINWIYFLFFFYLLIFDFNLCKRGAYYAVSFFFFN